MDKTWWTQCNGYGDWGHDNRGYGRYGQGLTQNNPLHIGEDGMGGEGSGGVPNANGPLRSVDTTSYWTWTYT